jgi:serine phosphatase RsbU (regulator of sigma subunit)
LSITLNHFDFEIAILHIMIKFKSAYAGLLFVLLPLAGVGQVNETNHALRQKIDSAQQSLTPNNFPQQITTYKEIGNIFQQLNKFDSAIYYYKKAAGIAEEISKPEALSPVVYNLSLVYLKKGLYNTALEYGLRALEIDRSLNQAENISASLNIVALIFQEWGIYEKALEYRLESIKLAEETGNKVEIAHGNYNLGSLYRKLDKPGIALKYFLVAKVNYSELESQLELSESIYSIGDIYLIQKNYVEAIQLFNEALSIKQQLSDKAGIGNCYNQIGLAHALQNQYKQAVDNYSSALGFKILVNDNKGIALTYLRLGSVMFQQDKYVESERYILKSIPVALAINDKEILSESYKILYQLYSAKADFRNAFNYHKLHKAYADSVSNENTRKVVERLSIQFETEKKEKENKILALTIQRQKSLGYSLIGVIVFVLTIVVILYLLYRSKRRTNKIISHKNTLLNEQNTQIATQKKEIEEKNLNLTDSITYAKRIQESLLSDVAELNQQLDDAFILFKPKDIVSGDFYWFGKTGNKFIVSAIDCTGHGVPGAFMSMLGNSFLNQIILHDGITAPEEILERLSTDVKVALKQEETENRDGMDMALCSINLITKDVAFAGAKNPLVVIENGEATRIKGDKLPIGFSHYDDLSFTKHLLEYKQYPRSFYMFSDGYADQFGGSDGRKFMIKRLQNLLLEIHKLPMSEQFRRLDNEIETWMENEEQIDDILIVGFKIN